MSSLQTSLLGKRVVFIREHNILDTKGGTALRPEVFKYKGLVGKVVSVNAWGGAINVIVCPENTTVPMANVDVSYLQLVKEEPKNVQEQVLEVLKEANAVGEDQLPISRNMMDQILEDMRPKTPPPYELAKDDMRVDGLPSSLGGSDGTEG